MATYYQRLLRHYGVLPDRRGWSHVACPKCGSEPSQQYGDTHFSFSERGANGLGGGKCFVCGYVCSLGELTMEVGAEDFVAGDEDSHISPDAWRRFGWLDSPFNREKLTRLIKEWNRQGYALWRMYRRIPEEAYNFYKLGYGVLPAYSSSCQHPRIIVPLITQQGYPMGLRARRVKCGCPKWLGISGNKKVLYNGASLVSRESECKEHFLGKSIFRVHKKETLFIVENPVDAILLYTKYGLKALATLGVTMWDPVWGELIKEKNPKKVVVWYDNDLAGCPTDIAYEEQRMERVRKTGIDHVPIPRGIVLVDTLVSLGINAVPYAWSENSKIHADIGMYL